MIKAVKYTLRGMNQDLTEDKHPIQFYYAADNIRLTTTQDVITGAMSFEKGNQLKVTIPTVTIVGKTISYIVGTQTKTLNFFTTELSPTTSNDQKIIGYSVTRNSVILFTTGTNLDCIWEVNNEDYDLTLLYARDLSFSINNPIQTIFNYENEDIQKIYWIDGKEQIRNINIRHANIEGNEALIDVSSNSLNFVGNVYLSQPIISEISSGGNHTSGMIQYAYNLYRLNSSQTKLSPLSELIPLDKGAGQGGGALNEVVGATPVIQINNIDTSYTHIKVYSIKYTSYNQTPSVSLIEEREIGENSSITVFDDGNSLGALSLEELIFLGSNPIIPQHIESKDSILFPINIKEKFFDVNIDTRAYSFTVNGACTILDRITGLNVYGSPIGPTKQVSSTTYLLDESSAAVNPNYNTYKYQAGGGSPPLGGEGKYIKYEIVQKALTNPENYRVLKDEEIYRIGIQFYNKLGQVTPAKWIADFKTPAGNLSGTYNTLKVTLKPDFDTWLATSSNFETENDIPIGYKILRAKREISDRIILDQGLLSPMIFQVKTEEVSDDGAFGSEILRETYQDSYVKLPTYLLRNFDTVPTTYSSRNGVLAETKHLYWLNENGGSLAEGGEIFGGPERNRLSQTFQHTKMMQFYSPEILFNVLTNIPSGLQLHIRGVQLNTENGVFGQEITISTKQERYGGKTLGGLNPQLITSNNYLYNNDFKKLFNANAGISDDNNWGFIGPTGDNNYMDFYQFYREYSTWHENTSNIGYAIYNAPEITARGAGNKLYANDPRYEYNNSLQSILSDGTDNWNPIESLNSYGTQCATLVLGSSEQQTSERLGLEDLVPPALSSYTEGVLIGELRRPIGYEYTGNIYGGNSYEEKKRTTYVEIGDYQELESSNNVVQIDSAGDTFVQDFNFLRIGKTDLEVYSSSQKQFSEIVKVKVETSVDLKNRNDISLFSWDSRFQPTDTEFHSYNRVYSQQPNIIVNSDFDFTFRRVKNFDTRIVATKVKIPNESIDSWTDILENTAMDLDGKYGPINAVVNFRDNIFTLQDNGVAQIAINPRVQTQANDGISIELGTGATLYDYQYITTRVGCINKWGVIDTDESFYFIDGLNKSLFRFSGQLQNLSDTHGFHKYLRDNLNITNLRVDNPLINQGVSFGYDPVNRDVYMSIDNSWTLCYNEFLNSFTSFYSYNSPIYIYNKEKLLTIDKNNSNTLYEIHAGDYNVFYGTPTPSKLILLCNPEPDHECTFNNLEFKAEATNGSKDLNYTWETIRAYNEFQNSGYKNVDYRKLNRKYRLIIPRNSGSTDRIRNTWAFIELISNNSNSYKYTNHDIILYYVPNYIMIQ